MAEDQQHSGGTPVGSVAEEAARLLDAIGGWAERSGYAAEAAPDAAPAPPTDAPAGESSPVPPGAPGRARAADRCAACGAQEGVGRAASCQVCPVCQGISLLRSVRPETVDRLADLATALAATLRDVAGQRRADFPAPEQGPEPRPGGRVQDIRIDDEDDHGDGDEHGEGARA